MRTAVQMVSCSFSALHGYRIRHVLICDQTGSEYSYFKLDHTTVFILLD
jgi:hypothetical protein